jgi:opacity protein-like surface antigen
LTAIGRRANVGFVHRLLFAFVLTLASCASAPGAQRPSEMRRETSSKLDLYFGVRSLDGDDWAPVENQGTLGIEYVHESPGSALGFELAFFASGANKEDGVGTDERGGTGELSLGLHKTFGTGSDPVHPYIGGGVAAIHAEAKGVPGNESVKDDDGSAGVYVHGGILFDIGPTMLLGLDLRFLGGTDITLFGQDASADYVQAALVLGVGF